MRGGLLAALLSACIQSSSVTCADDRLCPAGTTCRQIASLTASGVSLFDVCATPEQLAACVGKAQGDTCALADAGNPVCEDGICVDAVCGNGRIDPGEQCDDGASSASDGCVNCQLTSAAPSR